jgi:hypothetical protein
VLGAAPPLRRDILRHPSIGDVPALQALMVTAYVFDQGAATLRAYVGWGVRGQRAFHHFHTSDTMSISVTSRPRPADWCACDARVSAGLRRTPRPEPPAGVAQPPSLPRGLEPAPLLTGLGQLPIAAQTDGQHFPTPGGRIAGGQGEAGRWLSATEVAGRHRDMEQTESGVVAEALIVPGRSISSRRRRTPRRPGPRVSR